MTISNSEMVALDIILNGPKTSRAQAELNAAKARRVLSRMEKEWRKDDGTDKR